MAAFAAPSLFVSHPGSDWTDRRIGDWVGGRRSGGLMGDGHRGCRLEPERDYLPAAEINMTQPGRSALIHLV